MTATAMTLTANMICNRCGDGVIGPLSRATMGTKSIKTAADCSLDTCGDGQLDPNEQCDDGNNSNQDSCLNNCLSIGRSCLDLLEQGARREDGSYLIQPQEGGVVTKVFCDMTTDGGGWTLAYKIDGREVNGPYPHAIGGHQLQTISNTNYAKLSDDDINAIGASAFWNICGRRQTIYRRSERAWYSDHGSIM